MDFAKPIYAEIQEDEKEVIKFREYLETNNIQYVESTEDYHTIDGVHIFECIMTKEQLIEANNEIDALFYQ